LERCDGGGRRSRHGGGHSGKYCYGEDEIASYATLEAPSCLGHRFIYGSRHRLNAVSF
jgi:hypothetical protein